MEYILQIYCPVSVICGERVSQMTKVYDDIEAVTHLLEEVSRWWHCKLMQTSRWTSFCTIIQCSLVNHTVIPLEYLEWWPRYYQSTLFTTPMQVIFSVVSRLVERAWLGACSKNRPVFAGAKQAACNKVWTTWGRSPQLSGAGMYIDGEVLEKLRIRNVLL